MNPADFDRITVVLAELDRDGIRTPTYETVLRWAKVGKVRAVNVGANRFLVHRNDVRGMVTPKPLAGGAA
ncbi:hypothetical protein H7I53_23090 [Mycolicibacterium pulveris]|uniref:Uncharacterized protein n=1 Tax=Mycolicibacterium pulveris TaxID=36813 RepID=A0A7I7UNH8_MYCPV|nr:hypothetical protein [Mycolicibacterium pulveris]MCV6983093.1 hypothetical protein [Mycolicibacterium pulveris]BBY82958.1 hypothetical protein MPUL_41160 [Mycolicibacterium pulveris]